jgi:hypothetical protein
MQLFDNQLLVLFKNLINYLNRILTESDNFAGRLTEN